MATVTGLEQKSMEKLIKALDVHRTSFQRNYDSAIALLESTEPDFIEIQSKLHMLQKKIEILSELDKQLLDILLETDSNDVDIDVEVEKSDHFILLFNNLKFKVDSSMHSVKFNEVENSTSHQRKLKLPTIELTKFGGDIRDWLVFWAQFKQIDQDDNLTNEDKFQYLIQATIPKSRARRVVNSYPPTSDNYPKVIESLKSRFGREDLLVEMYIRELLKLILNNFNGKSNLSYLYDKIESQLRALETLGVNSDKCAAILYPLIESCLPEETIRVWQRNLNFSEEDTLKKRLDGLMSFLRKEVENEERITLATAGFDFYKSNKKKEYTSTTSALVPTASTLMNTKILRCIFCKDDHKNEQCPNAARLSVEERKKIISQKGCCHICLKFGHIARKCRTAARLKCKKCSGQHVDLMCSKDDNSESTVPSTENLSNQTYNEIFLQTLVVKLQNDIESKYVRAIIDTGSQRSYINKFTATEMKFIPIRTEEMIHSLFGGVQSETNFHDCYRVKLQSLDDEYACNLEVLDQTLICNNVVSIHEGPWNQELDDLNIKITDKKPGPIDILIGADVAGKLLCGPRHILSCGLVAVRTSLGWTLMGKPNLLNSSKESHNMFVTSLFNKSSTMSDLWTLDILGITDPDEQKSKKEHEQSIRNHFDSTVTRNEEGRYQVCMPWVNGHPPLSNNFHLAKRRLDALMCKLKKDGYYDEYNRVFQEWLSENIIELVSEEEKEAEAHYLPHRHVIKLNSVTTKLRPVFDASAKQKGHPALNQCLEKGINLISLIPSILLNFRMSKIGVTSDIRQAFLQISLHKSQRDFLRFLWYDTDQNLIYYRHQRVVFGVSCSPFLLGAVINYHLQNCLMKNISENNISKETILKLMKSFYVDNCVTSVDDEKELARFKDESQRVMAEAQFDLRCWEHTILNDDSIEKSISSPVLGLNWNKFSDTLSICCDGLKNLELNPVTKRFILSVANRIYDPIGFVIPILLLPKLLLQRAWIAKIDWNTEVPEDMKKDFLRWMKGLSSLADVKIPRWLMHTSDKMCRKLSLHVFCDASQVAYATAVFLRVESSQYVTVQLVQAKSRISPIKKISIPRLELLAATIGARLLNTVRENFDVIDMSTFLWTDSSTVLSWINRKDKWKPFVWNRAKEIRELTEVINWHYVPGSLNPADLPSRGCTITQLLETKWWKGPQWLYLSENEWPVSEYSINEDEVLKEKRRDVISLLSHTKPDYGFLYRYFSKYEKIINLICWMRRLMYKKYGYQRPKELTVEEKEDAEKVLIRCIQQEGFYNEEDRVSSLATFKDDEGILRLKTKITERDDIKDFRFPALLPAKHVVVLRLIHDYHVRYCHVGVQGLLSILREKFWILRGRKTVKSVITKCSVCRRYNVKTCEAEPVTLPKDRVKDAAVFEITGIDLFGHLYLRNKDKIWICIFTCAVYRAVHLEIVSHLSTECFLQAFRRFIARRGRPSVVYSDNGRNFVGAETAFAALNWDDIQRNHSVSRISWKFNPPSAAWWGGWWERLIRLIKQLLRKVLGRACLNYEELSTVLCDCEAIVNLRPLTYISEDTSDLVAITPSMFLQDITEVGVPDFDDIEAKDLRRRYKYRQTVRVDLRKRFRKEYLSQLIIRKKNNKRYHNLQKGQLVLVSSDNFKRIDWPLARVEEVIAGKDGEVRLVRLKTEGGVILRPVQKICPLEIDMIQKDIVKNLRNLEVQEKKDKNETSSRSESKGTITRYGRKVKPPERFNFGN